MYLYVPSLFTGNCHNTVNRLYPNTKYIVQKKNYIKGLAVKLLGMMASSLIKYGVLQDFCIDFFISNRKDNV